MNCKHCKKRVEPNTIRPDLIGYWKHAEGHLSLCFDENLMPMRDADGVALVATPEMPTPVKEELAEMMRSNPPFPLRTITDFLKVSIEEVIDAVGDPEKELALSLTMMQRMDRPRDIFREACEELMGGPIPL